MPEQSELDIKETLVFLGIGRSSLYRLMDEGKIKPCNTSPLLRRPRKLKFRRSDLERLLAEAQEDERERSFRRRVA